MSQQKAQIIKMLDLAEKLKLTILPHLKIQLKPAEIYAVLRKNPNLWGGEKPNIKRITNIFRKMKKMNATVLPDIIAKFKAEGFRVESEYFTDRRGQRRSRKTPPERHPPRPIFYESEIREYLNKYGVDLWNNEPDNFIKGMKENKFPTIEKDMRKIMERSERTPRARHGFKTPKEAIKAQARRRWFYENRRKSAAAGSSRRIQEQPSRLLNTSHPALSLRYRLGKKAERERHQEHAGNKTQGRSGGRRRRRRITRKKRGKGYSNLAKKTMLRQAKKRARGRKRRRTRRKRHRKKRRK